MRWLWFTVEVREHFPHHVLRPVTYPIWPNRWRYTFEVVVFGLPDGRFRVTDNVMTPLKTQTLCSECTLSATGRVYLRISMRSDYVLD
ncbi:hypothetical protein H2136_20125 [Aeromonas hydrophila]|uniref:Uncharacterized protein n=1 Tax=Aeromonas hydrophila TaxID=644 RepID=A0A926IYD5_AERHY|nr:hypothetical protein [Aeromonas hydrophila]